MIVYVLGILLAILLAGPPQDQTTDAAELWDAIDPPSAGGSLVVESPIQAPWDRTYDPPPMHRRGAELGVWRDHVTRQAAYRRDGVR